MATDPDKTLSPDDASDAADDAAPAAAVAAEVSKKLPAEPLAPPRPPQACLLLAPRASTHDGDRLHFQGIFREKPNVDDVKLAAKSITPAGFVGPKGITFKPNGTQWAALWYCEKVKESPAPAAPVADSSNSEG